MRQQKLKETDAYNPGKNSMTQCLEQAWKLSCYCNLSDIATAVTTLLVYEPRSCQIPSAVCKCLQPIPRCWSINPSRCHDVYRETTKILCFARFCCQNNRNRSDLILLATYLTPNWTLLFSTPKRADASLLNFGNDALENHGCWPEIQKWGKSNSSSPLL